jgi:MoxR-like ATPase|tara:strand:+ start:634 stop:900 length:267 start_codon:yes stop_codon:yes gene_type:complete
MRLRLGYPDQQAERELLEMNKERDKVEEVRQCLSTEVIAEFRRKSADVNASDTLLDYVQRLIAFTRGKEVCSILWKDSANIMPVPLHS